MQTLMGQNVDSIYNARELFMGHNKFNLLPCSSKF